MACKLGTQATQRSCRMHLRLTILCDLMILMRSGSNSLAIQTTAKQPARNQAGRRISCALISRSTRTLPHGKEPHPMPHSCPKDPAFAYWELDVLARDCHPWGRLMHICDPRYRHFYTLDGPVEL